MYQHRQMRSWIVSSSLSLIRTIPVPVRESKLYCPLWVAFPFSHTNNRSPLCCVSLLFIWMRGVRSDSLVRFELVILLWQITVMWCVDMENSTVVEFPAILTMGISKNECEFWLYSCFDNSWLAVFVCLGTFCLLIDMIDFALTQIDSINYSIPLRLLNTLSSPIIASWRYSSISIHHFNRISHGNSP